MLELPPPLSRPKKKRHPPQSTKKSLFYLLSFSQRAKQKITQSSPSRFIGADGDIDQIRFYLGELLRHEDPDHQQRKSKKRAVLKGATREPIAVQMAELMKVSIAPRNLEPIMKHPSDH